MARYLEEEPVEEIANLRKDRSIPGSSPQTHITADSDGERLIMCSENRIQILSTDGSLIESIYVGDDLEISGIAADSSSIYVSVWEQNMICAYSFAGKLVRSFVCSRPSEIALDHKKSHLYVLCQDSRQVAVFSAGGECVRTIDEGKLKSAQSIAVDEEENLVFVFNFLPSAPPSVAVFREDMFEKYFFDARWSESTSIVFDRSRGLLLASDCEGITAYSRQGEIVHSIKSSDVQFARMVVDSQGRIFAMKPGGQNIEMWC